MDGSKDLDLLPSLPKKVGNPPQKAFLLPPFDEVVLADRIRSASIEPGYEKRVHSYRGTSNPTILLDGNG
jgi:hypothetical protein